MRTDHDKLDRDGIPRMLSEAGVEFGWLRVYEVLLAIANRARRLCGFDAGVVLEWTADPTAEL